MMRTTWCPECQQEKDIVGYEQDDPIMLCGHKLDIESQLTRDELRDYLDRGVKGLILLTMQEQKVSYKEALKRVTKSLDHY